MEEKYFPILTINGNVDSYVDEPLEIGNFKGKTKPVYLEEPPPLFIVGRGQLKEVAKELKRLVEAE